MGTSPEGCDLLETSTDSSVGYPRAPFASGRHARSTLPPTRHEDLLTTHRRCSPGPSGRVVAQAPGPSRMGRSGSPPGRPPGRGSPGTPREGGPGPPKKGGCRDTKQCKFWRVSSVLIQGTFCFLGVRGVRRGSAGGCPGDPSQGPKPGGSGWGPSAPGPGPTWGWPVRGGVTSVRPGDLGVTPRIWQDDMSEA